MASEDGVNQHTSTVEKSNEYETTSTDRSLLDFMKKDDQDESQAITTEFDDKLHVSYPKPEPEAETKFEDCKVELLHKLHRSGSTSSSSSEEEVEEGGEIIKKKKEKKKKIHKEEDTSAPVQVVAEAEEKKGLMEKIKDKVPGPPGGDKKKVEEETVAPSPVEYDTVEGGGEPAAKKGILEKIKDKLPGGGHKVEEETVAPTPTPHLDHSPNVESGEPAKKGIMEKIKEKMPGYHAKTTAEEEEKKKETSDCA